MIPATPAAAWVWPMFDLIDPSHSGSVPVLPVGRQQRLRLDGVAQCGSGAVAFDHVDVGAVESGVGQRRAHHPLL